jgi:hypothetical protein
MSTKREFGRWAALIFETTGAAAWSEPRPQRKRRKNARMGWMGQIRVIYISVRVLPQRDSEEGGRGGFFNR